ncbi:HxlR family transcriptional regulator [Stackebrandtia albiflava]|uniref:HxlR family transcriptional regulator n=1 Tax=Stackebrandtia albiflava TaxID=406432 RepID=A0A562V1Q0_9ACTN|nr:helix-turn-helix domain-containing protein [Stackebrandtia albiflava]TWJ11727.1 HxlR family transcriptional regulator [Stackebrandtia albiflava]
MKTYGQYCGLARAAEFLGERWTLVILRDLLVGPKRFNELRHGIPGIPSNMLTNRLGDLERADVVERAIEGRSVVYRLSDYGRDLEPILLAIGRWGSRRMDAPREGERPTDSSLAAALLTGRTATKVVPFTVEVTVDPAVANAEVGETGASIAEGPLADADLRLGGSGLRRLLADGDVGAALGSGGLHFDGPASLVEEFARAFRVPLDPSGNR